jgi:ABC-type transporter Mla maintaining outer membrane lipid asymmetry permease subunit MlaE
MKPTFSGGGFRQRMGRKMNWLQGFKNFLSDVQGLAYFTIRLLRHSFGRPFYFAEFLEQMHFLGVGSLFLVVLTGMFAGQGSFPLSWRILVQKTTSGG